MLTFFTSPYFLLFARLCVGGVFLASSLGKMLDRPGTEASMSRYPFLPRGWGKLAARFLPVVELAAGLLLILGIVTRLAAVAAVLLFVVFTTFILYDLSHSQNSSCHCFGRLSDEKLTPVAVVRNVVLMALAALLAVSFDGWLSFDSRLGLVAGNANSPGLPSVVDAVPVFLLALATVGAIVLGGQAVSMVRTTLRGMGFR